VLNYLVLEKLSKLRKESFQTVPEHVLQKIKLKSAEILLALKHPEIIQSKETECEHKSNVHVGR